MALILGYNDEIRIVKPAWLKKEMAELLKRIIQNYQIVECLKKTSLKAKP
jgi:predicted DNA-binding transcriptional regulator YafY